MDYHISNDDLKATFAMMGIGCASLAANFIAEGNIHQYVNWMSRATALKSMLDRM